MSSGRIANHLLVAVTLIGLMAAVVPVRASEPTPGLEGEWTLVRKENFGEYLKASGAPWWKRKLAQLGSSKLRQTISIDGTHVEVTNDSPVETRTLKFVADGATELTAEGATGDAMTWTARFEEDVFVIDGHGDLGHRIIRREIADGSMLMTILNPDVDAQCKFYFERAETD